MMRFVIAPLMLSLALLAGCAGSQAHVRSEPAAHVADVQNAQPDLTRGYEERRAEAQLQAAMDRWQQGDIAGCEARLRGLVERNPQAIEPRLRLAELALASGHVDDAADFYRAVLALDANRADAHHGLAIVLDARGQSAEARVHFQQAYRLEPENELYRLSADAPGTLAAAQP